MRTLFFAVAILCIGLSGALLTGSGFNALIDAGGSTAGIQQQVDTAANNSSVGSEGLEGSTQGTDDSSIVGIVLSSAGEIARFIGLAVVAPMALISLGFPAWFAIPVGGVVSLIASIGLIQFVTGRVLR